MWLPLLLLFSVSITVSCKSDKLKEDHCSCQWNGNDLYKSNTQFAVSLYRAVSSKTASAPPNFFISPISIYTSLAMLALGARSSTQQQILGAMCLNASQSDKTLKDEFKNFLDKLTKQKDVKFRFSNWLFLEKSISPETQYQQDLVSYYGAYIQMIDFRDTLNAKRRINEQVSGHTDGKIEDLVSDVENRTMVALMDYAMLDAHWENPFTSQGTQRGLFKVTQKKTADVKMMHRKGQYKTFKDDAHDCIVIEVPYMGHAILLLIVPNNGDLDEVQRRLSVRLIEQYLSNTKTSLLDLYIPEIYKLQEVDVQSALMKMGIQQVFSDTADLSGISKQPGLKVSAIYHSTLINVEENKTEAADSAVIRVFTLPSIFKLKIDRPFLALVYNKPKKLILLIGRVTDPSQN